MNKIAISAAIMAAATMSLILGASPSDANVANKFTIGKLEVKEKSNLTEPLTVVAVLRNSANGNPISGVMVTNVVTGESVFSDSTGSAVFSEQTYNLGLLNLTADHSDFVSRLFAQELPENVCGSGCDDQVWTATLAMDPVDWLISPSIDSAGGSHLVVIPTGIVPAGTTDQYMQEIFATVPENAWTGTYRLGFSPMRTTSFNYTTYDDPSPNEYPVAGFTFRFLDPQTKTPVIGEPILEPLVFEMDAAYIKDLGVNPTTIEAWQVDHSGSTYSQNGVVSTTLVGDKIRVTVNEAGTYQIFAGELPSLPGIPLSGGFVWVLCEPFKWKTPCSVEGADGNDLPTFGCTTYTAGQAEELSTDETKTKSRTSVINGKLEAKLEASIPFLTGAKFKVAVEGGTEWESTSEWTKEVKIGTRTYSPPLCGEVCITMKSGMLKLCEGMFLANEELGAPDVWYPTGNIQETMLIGSTCIADSLSACGS